jgi:hypothetical protein
MLFGVLERQLIQGVPALFGQSRLGPVGIQPGGRVRQIEGNRDLVVDVVEIDQVPTLHVEEQTPAHPLCEPGSPLSEFVKPLAPENLRQCSSNVGAL